MLYSSEICRERARDLRLWRIRLASRESLCDRTDENVGWTTVMDASLSPARRDELLDDVARRLSAWGLRAPAVLLLEMHSPLAFLGGQILFATRPFLGWLTGDRLFHDLAYLLEEPENVDLLISRLEKQGIR